MQVAKEIAEKWKFKEEAEKRRKLDEEETPEMAEKRRVFEEEIERADAAAGRAKYVEGEVRPQAAEAAGPLLVPPGRSFAAKGSAGGDELGGHGARWGEAAVRRRPSK